jgi:FG-GAP repeat
VAVAADGSHIAVGSRSSSKGSVSMFKRVTGPDAWEQVGKTIYGEADLDDFGHSVAMSADGSHVAVGAPMGETRGSVYIFKNVTDSWDKVGNAITGVSRNSSTDFFGWSVAMSADGSRVAVASECDVHMFREPPTGSDWIQVGNGINVQDDYHNCGLVDFGGHRCVAMSANGTRVAVGLIAHPNFWADTAYVRVFDKVTGSPDWIQIGGNDMRGYFFDEFGTSVAMSADGTRLAVGEKGTSVAMSADGTRLAAGSDGGAPNVHVFREPTGSGTDWTQIGNEIGHEAVGDAARVSVFDEPNTGSDSAWIQVGSMIDYDDDFGSSVAMSGDGATLVVGASQHIIGNATLGHARVFVLAPSSVRANEGGNG